MYYFVYFFYRRFDKRNFFFWIKQQIINHALMSMHRSYTEIKEIDLEEMKLEDNNSQKDGKYQFEPNLPNAMENGKSNYFFLVPIQNFY